MRARRSFENGGPEEQEQRKERLRQISALIAGLTLVLCAIGKAAAANPAATAIELQADRIAFYYDRYLIEADGHVRVRTSDGMTVTGDAFSMDLKLNRFLIASNVHLRSPGGSLDGAAISDYLDFNRVYFVPVISEPDRWTYENSDFTHPLKGRIMPDDVFYFPDLSSTHRSLTASSARIQARQYVRFSNVRASFFHQGIPLPSYYVYFGSSQDLAVNSLSGANLDGTWNATGNANSITAIHIRYDEFNHTYLSFEQHLAGTDPHEYAVFSVNPATKDDKYWNLVTGEHIGSKFEVNTFTQLYTFQDFLAEPSASAQTTYVQMTQALPRSYLQAFFDQTDYNMVGPKAPAEPNHPNFLTLTATSYNNQILKLPLYEQLEFQFGFNHDAYGLQNYGGYDYTTIWNHLAGFTLTMPSVKIGDRDSAYRVYSLNATLNSTRQWLTVPHHINSQNSTISLSRQFSRYVNSYLSYNVQNTSDLYEHGGYQPYEPLLAPGVYYAPYAAFRGASTLRVASLGTTYSASPNLVSTITLAHHQDFPAAYPGLFVAPPLNAIGQYIYSNYLGQPPWQLTGEIRTRIAPHLVVDLQRTYYFHFGDEIWSPSFVLQLSQ
jgi:hypothetical protein